MSACASRINDWPNKGGSFNKFRTMKEQKKDTRHRFNRRTNEYVRVKNTIDVDLKRFENPDEIRTFENGKFEIVQIGGMTIGRATYEPGWKWSSHVGVALGKKSCEVEHIGMVVTGKAAVAMDDGRIEEIAAGDIFYIAPGHDSWVLGDEPYVSLHFMGASDYANRNRP
jgi:mannose-6-phosphate isomerase-like protein (cupin superfamily)